MPLCLYLQVNAPAERLGEYLAAARALLPEALALVKPMLPDLATHVVGAISPRVAGLLGGNLATLADRFMAWAGAIVLGVAEVDPNHFRQAALYAEQLAQLGRQQLQARGEL